MCVSAYEMYTSNPTEYTLLPKGRVCVCVCVCVSVGVVSQRLHVVTPGNSSAVLRQLAKR